MRDVPHTALQFTFYGSTQTLKNWFARSDTDTPRRLTIVHDMVAGGSAGLLAGFLTTPLDVVSLVQIANPVHKTPAQFIFNPPPQFPGKNLPPNPKIHRPLSHPRPAPTLLPHP
ncbi:hypothetical protein BDK51DRAFT_52675 [Blyttiomyces helicus]|uniref:Mitochondrial carrier domain-containing protein n=1 Tax=Blyttiomyces helicus TaxID=388810 RepID=A0A4P9W139_9FUNG|nr:hypothetical protein BDK51DRAFT_52675 [Blyttiomyces helicus]|eukprot:RKO84408.1 hypothetical protein BDK51DRAFT_52675 [Blyttiomyces helicus]